MYVIKYSKTFDFDVGEREKKRQQQEQCILCLCVNSGPKQFIMTKWHFGAIYNEYVANKLDTAIQKCYGCLRCIALQRIRSFSRPNINCIRIRMLWFCVCVCFVCLLFLLNYTFLFLFCWFIDKVVRTRKILRPWCNLILDPVFKCVCVLLFFSFFL